MRSPIIILTDIYQSLLLYPYSQVKGWIWLPAYGTVRRAKDNTPRDSTRGTDRGDSRANKYRKGRDGMKYRSKNKSDEASDVVGRKEFNALRKDLNRLLNNHNKDDHSESSGSEEPSP